jgi:hypothetical protein
MQHHLVRQRIRYLIEYGGVYPADEPASKNFVVKWFAVLMAINIVQLVILLR